MNLPESGKIVVIEDKQEQAKPLLDKLNKSGYPVLYFDGEMGGLPTKPINGIRILFLDIVLRTEGQSSKTMISKCINVIKKIVDVNNGPFFIFAWTLHVEMKKDLEKALSKYNYIFRAVDIKKSDVLKESNGKFLLNETMFTKNLHNALNQHPVFKLLFNWRNLVSTASETVTNEFSQLFQYDDKWELNITKLIYKLSESYMGDVKFAKFLAEYKADQSSQDMRNLFFKEVIKNCLLAYNTIFTDKLEREIRLNNNTIELLDHFTFTEARDKEVIAKINSRILTDESPETGAIPGSLYKLDKRIKSIDLEPVFSNDVNDEKKKECLDMAIPIMLEVSTLCDYAQDKRKLARIVPGYLWPREHIGRLYNGYLKTPSPDQYLYFNDNLYNLCLDFRSFTSINFSLIKKKKPILRLRNEFFSMIQNSLASKISNPGVLALTLKARF